MAKGARGMGALMEINPCMCLEELTWGRENSWVNFIVKLFLKPDALQRPC